MESIFSMITIMICFGICMMVFNSVTSDSTGALQVTARIRLQAEAEKCRKERDFSNGTSVYDEFTIHKSFEETEEVPGLIEFTFSATTADGKTIAEYHEFVAR